MSAVPDNIVQFKLPAKKPRIYLKEAMPDQRKISVMPIKALTDPALTDGSIRTLGVLCSYCNRAGITWVSQARLAKDLNISRQAITNQIMRLRAAGYVEILKKGFRGERCNTLRVIYDSTVDAETAMAVTSSIEDTRPPLIIKEQRDQADKADLEGQQRVAQAISKALRQPAKRSPIVVKSTDTMTVKSIKNAIKKAKPASSQPVDNSLHIGHPAVSNEVQKEQLHRQPIGHSGVSLNAENTRSQGTSRQVVKESLLTRMNSSNLLTSNLTSVLGHQEIAELIADGIGAKDIEASLAVLLPLYRAEGIEPTASVLMVGIRQLKADAR
jgi:biotin operon repressor